MLNGLMFILGFVFLIKGADLLVDGATTFAKRLNIPDVVVGLTIVSFGTSVAELFVNISASLQHNSDIVVGNILGSNIFNSSVILGVAAMIFPLKVNDNTIWKEIPLSVAAGVVFLILANDKLFDSAQGSMLSRVDGIILLLFFIIFMRYTMTLAKEHQRLFEQQVVYRDSVLRASMFSVMGIAALIAGGQWVVNGATALAEQWNVSKSFIGLTIVAAGTSLPELAASTVAAYKKKPDIAVANVVGSNIFNIFFILGISSLISPVYYESARNIDAIAGVFLSMILFLFMFTFGKKSFDRKEGVFLVLAYAGYMFYLVTRG